MIDEYGRTAGIVTVEDIIEEVVGEIDDETDPLGGAVRRLSNGDWFVRGHVAITDLLDYGLELPVDSDAYNSVGGFVFGELGRLPKRGDTVTHNGYSIRVESVRENRIEAVRIRERRASASPARRAAPSSQLAFGDVQPQSAAAELHLVAGGDLGLHHAAAVDPGAVGGAEVAQHPAAVGEAQLRVAARDRVVGEHELAAGGAPEHEPAAGRGLEQAGRRGGAEPAARQRARGGQVGGEAVQLGAVVGAQRAVDAAAERVRVEPARDVAAAQPLDRALPRVLRWSHRAHGRSVPPLGTVAKQNCVRNCTKAFTRYGPRQPTGRFGG